MSLSISNKNLLKWMGCHLVFLAVLAIPWPLVLWGIQSSFRWPFWNGVSDHKKHMLAGPSPPCAFPQRTGTSLGLCQWAVVLWQSCSRSKALGAESCGSWRSSTEIILVSADGLPHMLAETCGDATEGTVMQLGCRGCSQLDISVSGRAAPSRFMVF